MSWTMTGRRLRSLLLTPTTALVLLAGCTPEDARRQPREERPAETVEVEAPAYDALIVGDEEYVATAPTPEAPGVAGVLPATFPGGLPLYAPSTIVDFHLQPEEPERVVFLSPERAETVAAAYFDQLRREGWRLTEDEPEIGRPGIWSKGGRRVEILLEEARPGTWIRVTYRPQ